MKLIDTKDAAGHVLCHDLTRIVRGESKGVVFRKGHIVAPEDIPVLLSIGKDHLYIWEKDETKLHENEAAQILCEVCRGAHMQPTPVKEGKIELIAETDGLFQVDTERLDAINGIEEIMIATRHNFDPVKKGDKLLGTRVIPLVIDREKMEQVRAAAGDTPLCSLTPYKKMRAGIVTTGNEVFYGRIKDTFTPVVEEKLSDYGIGTAFHELCSDDLEMIRDAVLKIKKAGADLIVCTGGMSVDPDDRTPGAIRASGARIVSYGAPVLPGAMFLLGYFEDGTPVLGLPGCVMYARATIFDLVLPRIAAGLPVTKKDLVHMGCGGLCLGCETCHFPSCGFGRC